MLDLLLGIHFCDSHNIEYNQSYEIEWVDANTLITKERIDLIAKLMMLRNLSGEVCLDFYEKIYVTHIEAFSLGTFQEPGDVNKSSTDDYIRTFRELYENISLNGFDDNISIVPVGKDNVILNGSHRTAIAVFLGIKIPVIRFNHLSANYSLTFFRERHLSEEYLSFLVSEYIKLKHNVFSGLIWSKAHKNISNFHNLLKELDIENSLVYIKNQLLDFNTHKNLIIDIYSAQAWLGNPRNYFPGAQSKAELTYERNKPLYFFILENLEINQILFIKSKFRELCRIGNHSIHIQDDYYSSLETAKVMLNPNSLLMLKELQLFRYPKAFEMIVDFKENISKFTSLDNITVTGSIIMGLLGIRNPNDVDFFYTKEDKFEMDTDNKYLYLLEKPLKNISYNPKEFFYFMGLKFLSIENLYHFKRRRNEKRDIYDLKSLEYYLESNDKSHHKFILLLNRFNVRLFYYRTRSKNRIIRSVIYLLKFLHLYSVLKKIYRKIFSNK